MLLKCFPLLLYFNISTLRVVKTCFDSVFSVVSKRVFGETGKMLLGLVVFVVRWERCVIMKRRAKMSGRGTKRK